jgi:hypothetical protein
MFFINIAGSVLVALYAGTTEENIESISVSNEIRMVSLQSMMLGISARKYISG